MNIKDFFDNLDRNILLANNKKTLNSLKKLGRKYIDNLPEDIQTKVKSEANSRYIKSLKLIKNKEKQLK